MLEYRKYRNKFTENAPETPPEPQNITTSIDNVIDAWVKSLKMALVTNGPEKRGLWDRFKNTLANVWHGREGESNPYKFVNKFGDKLGQPASQTESVLLPLSNYKELRTICESLEELINEDELAGTENLRLMQVIDQKAQQLKNVLKQILTTQNTSQNPIENPQNKNEPASSDSLKDDDKSPIVPPITPSVLPKKEPVAWEHLSDDEKYITPPTDENKSLDQLTTKDFERWDAYGGGTEHRFSKGIPKIIRIGDPRRGTEWDENKLKLLAKSGRVEDLNNPIKNKMDFENRVREAKERIEAERIKNAELRNKRKTLGGEEQVGTIATALQKAKKDKIQTGPVKTVAEPVAADDLSKKPYEPNFQIGNLEPKHTPNNNLAPTAHKSDFKIADMPTDSTSKTSSINTSNVDNTINTDNTTDDDEDPLNTIKFPSKEESNSDLDFKMKIKSVVKSAKAKMEKYLIDKVKNEEVRNKLWEKVNSINSKGKDPSTIEKEINDIKDEIWQAVSDEHDAIIQKLIQNGAGDRETARKWMASGRTESVKDLAKLGQLKLERKKTSDLPFKEKVNHFKTLLKN